MALDQVFLEEVETGRSAPVLRLYRWSPVALSLGYFQPVREADLVACRGLGIDVVRRPTGGRAVLHDREATYAVIAPADDLFGAGVMGSYKGIAMALRRSLHSLGLRAELAEGRRHGLAGGASANCFAAPAMAELVFQGCKVAGNAQKRTGAAFLQHGSIPIDMDLERLGRILRPDDLPHAEEDAGQLAAKVGWLNRWLVPPVTIMAVEEALIAGFAAELGLDFRADEPTAAEWDRAHFLAAAKYGDKRWTIDPEERNDRLPRN